MFKMLKMFKTGIIPEKSGRLEGAKESPSDCNLVSYLRVEVNLILIECKQKPQYLLTKSVIDTSSTTDETRVSTYFPLHIGKSQVQSRAN